jgi:carboxylesterase
MACIREVDKLRRQLLPRLGQITCPTLIVHADEDDITSPRSAHHLQKHLGGPVDFMPLSDSYHMILVDNERMAVLARSVDFFQSSLPAVLRSAAVRKKTGRQPCHGLIATSDCGPPRHAWRPVFFRAAKFPCFMFCNTLGRFVIHRHQAGTPRHTAKTLAAQCPCGLLAHCLPCFSLATDTPSP